MLLLLSPHPNQPLRNWALSSSSFHAFLPASALPQMYKQLQPWQKVNHFPGTWVLGSKDRLARHIDEMRRQYPDVFQIAPASYVLPRDTAALERMIKTRKVSACLPVCALSVCMNAWTHLSAWVLVRVPMLGVCVCTCTRACSRPPQRRM